MNIPEPITRLHQQSMKMKRRVFICDPWIIFRPRTHIFCGKESPVLSPPLTPTRLTRLELPKRTLAPSRLSGRYGGHWRRSRHSYERHHSSRFTQCAAAFLSAPNVITHRPGQDRGVRRHFRFCSPVTGRHAVQTLNQRARRVSSNPFLKVLPAVDGG